MMNPHQTTDLPGFLELARQRRDRYEAGALDRAREADRSGYSNPNMFSNEMRTMSQLNDARFAAQASPSWDAWFEAAQQGGWRAPQSRVSAGRPIQRANSQKIVEPAATALRSQADAHYAKKYPGAR